MIHLVRFIENGRIRQRVFTSGFHAKLAEKIIGMTATAAVVHRETLNLSLEEYHQQVRKPTC